MRSICFATIVASSLVLLSNSVSAFSCHCHPSAARATSGTAGVTQLSFKADCAKAKEVDLREGQSFRKRIRYVGGKVLGRMDTMRSAGLTVGRHPPMQMGFKSNVGLLVGAFLFKWYRARFINKIPVWDRQPQWNMVVTSPEQEKELHAFECKSCGATIFIARHREWFFQGGNTKCTNCGATGKDNFVDVRGEVIDSIDDDYFDYESPLDFVSAAERRKLVQQAGGDEDLAKKIAIDNVMKSKSLRFCVSCKVSIQESPN